MCVLTYGFNSECSITKFQFGPEDPYFAYFELSYFEGIGYGVGEFRSIPDEVQRIGTILGGGARKAAPLHTVTG